MGFSTFILCSSHVGGSATQEGEWWVQTGEQRRHSPPPLRKEKEDKLVLDEFCACISNINPNSLNIP